MELNIVIDLPALAASALAAASAADPTANAFVVGAIVTLGSFALVVALAVVAVSTTGERAENAIRVLKVLTRRKEPPAGGKDE
jgi:multisubunit Na+/H+ antiporter MnhC subunit